MAEATFTGERPGWGTNFDYDEARHLAAYDYASTLVVGKRVMDAGCGEGWGTQRLADHAASVLGVDYSDVAVAACRSKWDKANLDFKQVDLTEAPGAGQQFDVVLNFQVLEHIDDPGPFLRGLRSRVADDGLLMLTTPNLLMSFSENPYHVREYTAEELQALLGEVFGTVDIVGVQGNERVTAFDERRKQAIERILRLDPLGIRNILPQWLINFAFARLAVLVRQQAKGPESTDDLIEPADFFVAGENVDSALDLVALCRP
jgi:2-polyprenyl-3-methyl-5-hydroxy-6-metoxy-1,4-benzoquinol methylase